MISNMKSKYTEEIDAKNELHVQSGPGVYYTDDESLVAQLNVMFGCTDVGTQDHEDKNENL